MGKVKNHYNYLIIPEISRNSLLGLTTKSNKQTPTIFRLLSADNVRLPRLQYLDCPPQTLPVMSPPFVSHGVSSSVHSSPLCRVRAPLRPPSTIPPAFFFFFFFCMQLSCHSKRRSPTPDPPRTPPDEIDLETCTDAYLRSISCFTVTAAQFKCEERCFDNRKVGYSQPAPQYSVTQL